LTFIILSFIIFMKILVENKIFDLWISSKNTLVEKYFWRIWESNPSKIPCKGFPRPSASPKFFCILHTRYASALLLLSCCSSSWCSCSSSRYCTFNSIHCCSNI